MSSAEELIKKHEGCELRQYSDSRGYLTIGWGHCVDPRAGCEPLDPDFFEPDGSISQSTADEIFDEDLASATAPLNGIAWFGALSTARQAVLQDMCFQMGWGTLSGFKTFLGMISAGNYLAASQDMVRTLWAKQVPSRAAENAALMASGEWQT